MAHQPTSIVIPRNGIESGLHPVATPSRVQAKAAQRWKHLTDLLGGTLQMRTSDDHRTWLPKEPAETNAQYRVRLDRSFLFPAFRDTVDKLAARPFSHRPIQLQNDEGLDQRLALIEGNADKAGKNLTQFAKAWMRDAVVRGVSFNLIDFPATGGVQTLEDEIRFGIRPTWVHIHATDIVGMRFQKASASGQHYLSQVRYKLTTDEPAGEFGGSAVERIRVWSAPEMDPFGMPLVAEDGRRAKGTIQTWRLVDRTWRPESDPIEHSYPGIPLEPYYTAQTGFFTAEPPLEDLGWLNIAHWQSGSDQRNILRHARIPMRYEFGVASSAEEIEGSPPRVIGAQIVLESVNPDAKAGFVEHSGAGIDSGERDLERLEERMQQLGSAPLVERVSTATEAKINKGETMTVMQSWIRGLEDAVLASYLASARWLEWAEADRAGRQPRPDEELLPTDFGVDIFSDFAIADGDPAQAEMLLKARVAGEITRERFSLEWKARGILNDNMDVDAEVAELASEELSTLASGIPSMAEGGDAGVSRSPDNGDGG